MFPENYTFCAIIISMEIIETLTHWDRVTHTCVGKLVIVVSDNGLSPVRRQAIIWTNAGILSNFSKILIEIHAFSFKKMQSEMSSGKWWPFCLGFSVLRPGDVYAFVNRVIIGTDNSLPPVRRQAIAVTNADLLSILHYGTLIFIQEFGLENDVCKMSAILSQPRCVKYVTGHHSLFLQWVGPTPSASGLVCLN